MPARTDTTRTADPYAAPVSGGVAAPSVAPAPGYPAEGMPAAASTEEYWAADEHPADDSRLPVDNGTADVNRGYADDADRPYGRDPR